MGGGVTRNHSAWMAGSVPVYWGGERDTYLDVYNMDAIVYCSLPANLTGLAFNKTLGEQLGDTGLREHVYALLLPHFKPCAEEIMRLDADHEAYERKLLAPIAPFVGDAPSGVWNMSRMGEMVREAYVGLGYDAPEASLEHFLASKEVNLT